MRKHEQFASVHRLAASGVRSPLHIFIMRVQWNGWSVLKSRANRWLCGSKLWKVLKPVLHAQLPATHRNPAWVRRHHATRSPNPRLTASSPTQTPSSHSVPETRHLPTLHPVQSLEKLTPWNPHQHYTQSHFSTAGRPEWWLCAWWRLCDAGQLRVFKDHKETFSWQRGWWCGFCHKIRNFGLLLIGYTTFL